MNTTTAQITSIAEGLPDKALIELLLLALRLLERRGLANDSDRALLAQLEAERG